MNILSFHIWGQGQEGLGLQGCSHHCRPLSPAWSKFQDLKDHSAPFVPSSLGPCPCGEALSFRHRQPLGSDAPGTRTSAL